MDMEDDNEHSNYFPSCGQLPFEIMFHIVGYSAYHIENLVQLSRTCHFMNNLIMVEAHLYHSLMNHQELRQMLQKGVEERLQVEIEKNDGVVYEFSKIKAQYRYNAHSFLAVCFEAQFPAIYQYLKREPHYRNVIEYVTNKQWLVLFHRFYSAQKFLATVDELKGNASRITGTESQKRCMYQLLRGVSQSNSTNLPIHSLSNAVSLSSFEIDNNCSCINAPSKSPYSIHLTSFGFGDQNGPPMANLIGSLNNEEFHFSVSKDEHVSVRFNVTSMPTSHGIVFFCAYLTAQVLDDIVVRTWQSRPGTLIMILSETKFDENRVKSRINETTSASASWICPERLFLVFKISQIDRDWIREQMAPCVTSYKLNQTNYYENIRAEDYELEPEHSPKIRTGEQLLNENATEFASFVALVHKNNQRPRLETSPPRLQMYNRYSMSMGTNTTCTIL